MIAHSSDSYMYTYWHVLLILIISDKILLLSYRLDDNCLNNLLTSRTEPLKVNDAIMDYKNRV